MSLFRNSSVSASPPYRATAALFTTQNPAATAEVDLVCGGAIRARIEAGDVGGKPKQLTKLYDLPNVAAKRVLLVGLGDASQLSAARYLDVVREALKALRNGPARKAASWLAELAVQGRDAAWAVREHVIAAETALYRYDATRRKPEKPDGLTELARQRIPTPQGDYMGTVMAVAGLVEAAEQRVGARGTVGIGICATGAEYLDETAVAFMTCPLPPGMTTFTREPSRGTDGYSGVLVGPPASIWL